MKLAVFDLDGTLINSLEDIAEATNYSLRSLGFPEHELSKFNYFVGDGVKKLIERVLPPDNSDSFNAALELYNEYYDKNYTVKTYVYEGVLETLEKLRSSDVVLAVASNKSHQFVVNVIKHYFGENIFSIVCGKSENRPVKPDPAIIEYIIKSLNTDFEERFMVGDTAIDINTGKNSGLKTIGCLWGFRTREELVGAGADFIAQKPEDILKFICG